MHTSFSTEIEFESYSLVTAFMNSKSKVMLHDV